MTVHVAVYCPFLASVLLGAAAPTLARLLPPATATRLLVGSAVLAASSTCVAVAVLAFTLVGQLPAVAALGHWSAGQLQSANPVPRAVAAGAVVAACTGLLSGVLFVVTRTRAVLAARAFCSSVGGGRGQLVVVDEEIGAVAIPAGGGRILVSRAHLAALPAADRRALIAHESAHLRYHHHRYRLAAEFAVALDPLQRGVRAAVHHTTERWADEVAATTVGSRAVVARTLARSALRAMAGPSAPAWEAVALRSSGSRSVARVRALLNPAPRQRPGVVLAAGVLVACTLAASLHAQQDTEAFFEHAIAPAGDGTPSSGAGSR